MWLDPPTDGGAAELDGATEGGGTVVALEGGTVVALEGGTAVALEGGTAVALEGGTAVALEGGIPNSNSCSFCRTCACFAASIACSFRNASTSIALDPYHCNGVGAATLIDNLTRLSKQLLDTSAHVDHWAQVLDRLGPGVEARLKQTVGQEESRFSQASPCALKKLSSCWVHVISQTSQGCHP